MGERARRWLSADGCPLADGCESGAERPRRRLLEGGADGCPSRARAPHSRSRARTRPPQTRARRNARARERAHEHALAAVCTRACPPPPSLRLSESHPRACKFPARVRARADTAPALQTPRAAPEERDLVRVVPRRLTRPLARPSHPSRPDCVALAPTFRHDHDLVEPGHSRGTVRVSEYDCGTVCRGCTEGAPWRP